jgi:hypothetical protein
MPLVAAEQPTNKGAVAKWEILNIDQTGHAGVTDVTATLLQSNNGKDGTLTITVVHNFGTRQITSTKTVNADFKWNMDYLAISVSGMVFPFGSGSMPHSIVITFNSLPTSSAGNLPSTLSIDGNWKL